MICTGLFDHTMQNMETIKITKEAIIKKCPKCEYTETLPRSNRNVLFPNAIAMQKIQWDGDDSRRDMLQPKNVDGSVNEEFTEAYGYNPFDERTKSATPNIQGGLA